MVPAQAHHAEVGGEGRERIVGDLGPSRGDHREQGALAGIGLSHEPHVGDQLEGKLDFQCFAFFTRLPFPRRLMVAVAKRALPRPPRPPWRPAPRRPTPDFAYRFAGAHILEDGAGGTGRYTSSDEAPVWFFPFRARAVLGFQSVR